jgi:Cu(I)/Ag(I) efflux system protein CusF
MFKSLSLAIAVSLATLAPSFANTLTVGVVRKIDMKNAKITIKHGEIVNLDMPPMSMVFTVKDPTLLDGVVRGDKVKFVAMEEGGKLFITDIQSAE